MVRIEYRSRRQLAASKGCASGFRRAAGSACRTQHRLDSPRIPGKPLAALTSGRAPDSKYRGPLGRDARLVTDWGRPALYESATATRTGPTNAYWPGFDTRTTIPPRITRLTRRTFRMSSNGFASSTTRSAILPTSTLPASHSWPTTRRANQRRGNLVSSPTISLNSKSCIRR